MKVNGVYILICKSPPHIEVEVGNHTQEKGFTPAKRKELRSKLVADFKAKEYDKGLREAVSSLIANVSAAPRR